MAQYKLGTLLLLHMSLKISLDFVNVLNIKQGDTNERF